LTTNVSVGSSTASPAIGTVTSREAAVLPSVTVPEDAVKSPGGVADPGAVAQLTWRGQQTFGGGATWIVKDADTEVPVPSFTVTSEIVTEGVGAAAAGEGRERMSTAAAAAPATRRISEDERRIPGAGTTASMRSESTDHRCSWILVLGEIPCPGVGMDSERSSQATWRVSRRRCCSVSPPHTP
jgi:hypothetical protein